MKTKLKKHNVEPVKKALAAFNAGGQRVALVHATGTGKSYATSAIIEQGGYKNVLYLSPNNGINDYFTETLIKNLGDCMMLNYVLTYSYLLHHNLSSFKDKFDLIVLDELHRVGAKEWGKAVIELLELNKNADILGLTATEKRYLDNGRIMTEELGFNVVSRITLVDAIERGILPAPIYIIGFSDFDFIIKSLEELAVKCEADQEYLDEIKEIKVDWLNSNGLAGIVNERLPKDVRKIIVFSEGVDRYEDIKDKMFNTLTHAGFQNLHFFRADNSDSKEARESIKYFSQNNNPDEVKIIVAVNMLNEGIHAEGAEACFMFRKTTSGNIYTQQIGRVESNLNIERRPIIFDLVDNIDNDWGLFSLLGLKQQGKEVKMDRFLRRTYGKAGVIVDSYIEKEKRVLEKLNKLYKDLSIREFKEFVKINDRLPNTNIKEEKSLYNWMNRQINRGNQEVIDIYNQFKKYNIDDLKEFVKINDRLPRSNKKEEKLLYWWMNRQVNSGNQEIIDIYNQHSIKKYNIDDLEEFVKINNRPPKSNIKEEEPLYNWMNRQINKGNQEVIDIYNQYSIKKHNIDDLEEFVKINDRLPNSNIKEEKPLYSWMNRQINKGNQEIIDIYNRFEHKNPVTINTFKEFVKINNRLPKSNIKEEIPLYNRMNYQLHLGNQEVIDIYNRFHPDNHWKNKY